MKFALYIFIVFFLSRYRTISWMDVKIYVFPCNKQKNQIGIAEHTSTDALSIDLLLEFGYDWNKVTPIDVSGANDLLNLEAIKNIVWKVHATS